MDTDGRRTDRRWTTEAYLSYKLTNEPSAQVSYKLYVSDLNLRVMYWDVDGPESINMSNVNQIYQRLHINFNTCTL